MSPRQTYIISNSQRFLFQKHGLIGLDALEDFNHSHLTIVSLTGTTTATENERICHKINQKIIKLIACNLRMLVQISN